MARQVSRGLITEAEMQAALKRISYAPDIASASARRDLVIEAATEDEAVKRKIFIDLCPKLKKGAMLAPATPPRSPSPGSPPPPTGPSASSACTS